MSSKQNIRTLVVEKSLQIIVSLKNVQIFVSSSLVAFLKKMRRI